MKSRGFTLIELLIVVGIIAILAAIAIPNMLEAQVRAKVSRAKSDMRTIATALETYAVDNNKYPPNYDSGLYTPIAPDEGQTYAALSTPIAYISSATRDVFRPDSEESSRGFYFDYVGWDSVSVMLAKYPEPLRAYFSGSVTKWSLASIGPDRRNDTIGQYLNAPHNYIYDPTNGTVSVGDIVRTNVVQFGG